MAELESSLKTAPGGGTVYLVPDAVALCTQLHLVRRLMASEKFVIIIPIQGTITSDLPFCLAVTRLWKYFDVHERYQEISVSSSTKNLLIFFLCILFFLCFSPLTPVTCFPRLVQFTVFP